MLRAREKEGKIVTALDALRAIVAAVERAATKVDKDLAWSLLAVIAERQRRRFVMRGGRVAFER
jgi:hypothetical protein